MNGMNNTDIMCNFNLSPNGDPNENYDILNNIVMEIKSYICLENLLNSINIKCLIGYHKELSSLLLSEINFMIHIQYKIQKYLFRVTVYNNQY